MTSLPKGPRQSTLTIRGLDGRTWQGDGDGLATAVRDVARRHAAAQHATITALGLLALTAADLAAAHPLACPGCPTCQKILPRLRRALAAAAGSEVEGA